MHILSCFVVVCTVMLVAPSTGIAGQIHVSADEKCPVCGMFVAKYPDWIAQIEFRDSAPVVFDGVKDMFRYYFNMRKYDANRTWADIKSIRVTDYYSIEAINGRNAWYVTGSNVYGPMGNEFIPFATQSGAAEFLKDHGGEIIYRFDDITPKMISKIDQRR